MKSNYQGQERKNYIFNPRGQSRMYYSEGNYESGCTTLPADGIEKKHAIIIGSGIAGLSAAAFLVRDAKMPGENIAILESRPVFGGDLDGANLTGKGWVITGGREMDDHFECMWDLFKDIPSHDDPNVSILDAYKRLNEEDPNYSLCRVIHNCGQDAGFDFTFKVSDRGQREISKLMFTKNEGLYTSRKGNYPEVVPEGVTNFAFLGNHAEVERDCSFTTEKSVRSAMIAVYTLCGVKRAVPEVYGSIYDVRWLLKAAVDLRDGRPRNDMLPFDVPKWLEKPCQALQKGLLRRILPKLDRTDIGLLLRRLNVFSFPEE